MISKKVMTDIYVLGARVLNQIIWCESLEPNYLQVLPYFHCRTKEVLYLEQHHSLAKFVSCKVFVHNKHTRQCILLQR